MQLSIMPRFLASFLITTLTLATCTAFATNPSNSSEQDPPPSLQSLRVQAHNGQVRARWYTYPLTRHVKGVGVDGTTLTMDDQTIWKISSATASVARRWGVGTTFVIYPNNWTFSSLFSKYEYALYNEVTREFVEARLSQGPFTQYAILTTQIYQIGADLFIELSDGSRWKVYTSQTNLEKLRDWKLRQAILVGKNYCSLPFCGAEYMLININQNNSITVDLQ